MGGHAAKKKGRLQQFFFEKKAGRPRPKNYVESGPRAMSAPTPVTQHKEVFLVAGGQPFSSEKELLPYLKCADSTRRPM
jgi:hypothetical protein